MTSRREHLLTLAELTKGLAATYALIAEEFDALLALDDDSLPPDEESADHVRIGQWIAPLNITVCPIAQRPDQPVAKNGVKYQLKDLFTTANGSWDPSDKPGSIDPWAREQYLTPLFSEAGAATHLFAAVIGLDGQLIHGKQIVFWSDGIDKLVDPNYQKYIFQYTNERSGWCNLFMAPSAGYTPERGEAGPWCWSPVGASDVIVGGGLPNRQHVSIFAVWQAVRA